MHALRCVLPRLWWGVFPTGAAGPIILAAVKPDSLTRGRQLEEFHCPSAAWDEIRGIGEARPLCRSVHVWRLGVVIQSHLQHFDPFAAWTRCLGVNAHRAVNTRTYYTFLNTTSISSVWWLLSSTFVPLSATICLLQLEEFLWRVSYDS